MKRVLIAIVSLMSCVALGCQSETQIETPGAESISQSQAASAGDITLSVKSWEELQAWIAEQKGKVVVVDFWSTSCGPCVAELPSFNELQKIHGDQVVCVSFSLDYFGSGEGPSEKLQEQVLGVLKKLGITTTNFLSSDKDEDVTAAIEVAAIPAAMVYDREGNMHKKFTNDEGEFGKEGYTYKKDIYPVVEELVGKGE